MNRASIHQAFVEPKSSVNLKLKEIDDLLVEYPWFTGGYLIKLTKLKLENDFRFDSFLSQTAVRFQDRAALKQRVDDLENSNVEKLNEPSNTSDFSTAPDETEKNIREIGASYRHVMESVEKAIHSSDSDSFIPEFHSVEENPAELSVEEVEQSSPVFEQTEDVEIQPEIEEIPSVENLEIEVEATEVQEIEDSTSSIQSEDSPLETQAEKIQNEIETTTDFEEFDVQPVDISTQDENESTSDEFVSDYPLESTSIEENQVEIEDEILENESVVFEETEDKSVEIQPINTSSTFNSLADFLSALQPEEKPKPTLPEIKELIPDYVASVDYFKVKDEPISSIEVEQTPSNKEEVEDLFEEPISDTLARIYEMQGAYVMAIEVYEKLCLKFPNKKSYFAGRIETIQTKINQK